MKSSFLVGISLAALTLAGSTASIAQETTAPKSPETSTTAMPSPATTATPSPATANAAVKGDYATMQSAADWRSSKVIGLNVYNSKAEKIGDINDLIIGSNGEVAYAVVGVGGFLGLGEKNVAIPFSAVKMSRDKDGKPSASVESTKEALQAAPTFKFYTSNS
jgi:sporulation protein YlmC with PRC-barrel domain